jgi:hypothetical protein
MQRKPSLELPGKLPAFNYIQSDNSIATDASDEDDDFGLHANWAEKVITVVATALAVLVVAATAVLMGMA